MNRINRELSGLAKEAAQEIFQAIKEVGCGNFWLNKCWNIFAEQTVDVHWGSEVGDYISITLELYSEGGELVDEGYDSEDTESVSVKQLYQSIARILARNPEIWED